jgi:hypothetical protein
MLFSMFVDWIDDVFPWGAYGFFALLSLLVIIAFIVSWFVGWPVWSKVVLGVGSVPAIWYFWILKYVD